MVSDVDRWPVVETEPVRDIFATEIAEIEIMGGNVRFVLCVPRHVPGTDINERVVVAKIVTPIPDALEMIEFSRSTLQPPSNVVLFKPRH